MKCTFGEIAHERQKAWWLQFGVERGRLRVGWWRNGHARSPRILTHRNNAFTPIGGFELDLLWLSIAWEPRQFDMWKEWCE